jgi:hypothetical protein
MYLPSFTHPDKLEDYIERCKAIIDQSLEEYHKAWRTGFPRDKYLTRADYYAGRMLKAEERLEEITKHP